MPRKAKSKTKIRRFLNNTRKRLTIQDGVPKAVIEPTLHGYNVLFLFDLTEEQFDTASEAREAALKAPSAWLAKEEPEKQPSGETDKQKESQEVPKPSPLTLVKSTEQPKDELAAMWYVNVTESKTGRVLQSLQATSQQEAEWLVKGVKAASDPETQECVIVGPES